ncbi:hypothetical protein PIROE2DRAFT_64456 [Piromyces sp. E2]|nr:hypothetical protein PIROE2DRAFT_64456 [Piromyces sp. E2]|eukprot:OUM58369.1 hypothetical protein PIROE2DRAFT_64456 [Piromyces sp. E2]
MYFELLIGMKTISSNALFIHPLKATLCRFISDDRFETLTPIIEKQDTDYVLCFIKCVGKEMIVNSFKLEDWNDNDDLIVSPLFPIKDDNLTPKEYLHLPEFIASLDRDDVVNTLDSYIDVVATSSEELTPSDLGPHKINLVPDAKSVKK